MRFALLATLAGAASAASQWSFTDAKVEIFPKTASAASPDTISHVVSAKEPVKDTVVLGHADKLKVSLTTKNGNQAKRPHQAFLMVKEKGGLEAPFAFALKESGTGTADFVIFPTPGPERRWEAGIHKLQVQHQLPVQHVASEEPLEVSLLVGSLGSTKASITPLFDLVLRLDPNAPSSNYENPLRFGQQSEIHHIFRDDPKSPPKIVSIVFALAILATIPGLLIGVRSYCN